MSPKNRSRAECSRLIEEVDNFLTAFEAAKKAPKSVELLDELTAAVIRLERARDHLR